MTRIWPALVLVLLFSSAAFAGVSSCGTSPGLVADGTTNGLDTIPANTTYYYYVNLTVGHSYVAEVWDTVDPYNGSNPSLALVTGASCATGPSYTDVSSYEPVFAGIYADRISFVAAASTAYQISLKNPDGSNGYKYYIRLADTTLYNPSWSTYAGYITEWSFQNTTSSSISGTLTVVTTLGGTVANVVLNFSIPANSVVLQYVGPGENANIAANHAGNASFTFIGPTGGILASAYLINGPTTVIVPAKFEAVRAIH